MIEAARRLVRAHVPSAAAETVEPLGEGEDNVAFLVDGRLVVRFTKDGDAARAAARVQRDTRLLATVAQISSVPVPRPVFAAADEGCIAYERLPGVPLLELLYGERRLGAPVRSASVGRGLGAFLRELHDTPREPVAEVVDVDDVPPADWLAEAHDHHRRVRDELPRRSARAIEAWLGEPPPPGDGPVVFSHNDLGAEHVLVDPDTFAITGIIDWTDAALVDPARDLGLVLRDLGPQGLERVLAAYRPDADDLAGLRERSRFYARCGALEDLVFGLETGRTVYTRKSLIGLSWLFGSC